MRYQDQLVRDTKGAVDSLFKAARAMPEDKLTWKVNDAGRTALDVCAECAQVIPSTITMLQTGAMPPMEQDAMQKAREERASWTLDDCERLCRERIEGLYDAIAKCSDEDLQKPIALPFGNRDWRLADVAGYLYWNLTYHLGQISFIQTLYGDQEMYF